MTKLNARSANFALIAGHVAGMIDLAALPIWVDTLIDGYGYRPALGGALPTSFLLGAVIASLFLSRRFDKVQARTLAPAGYWVAGACLLAVTVVHGFAIHLLLHLVGGMATGAALSVVHGPRAQLGGVRRAAGGEPAGQRGIRRGAQIVAVGDGRVPEAGIDQGVQ